MSWTFDEIFVGERNRSMGILDSSLSDELSRQLAHHLDLPGQPPQGFSVTSYISGGAIGDKYVIARTTADRGAERRGMVFSHALVIDKSAARDINNLRPVVDVLLSERQPQLAASQKTIHTNGEEPPPPPGKFCDMLAARPATVIVLTDGARYEDMIIRTWARLLPSMRADLRFGMSFEPEESRQQGLHIALVPSISLVRWPVERRADTVADTDPAQTAAGRYLARADEGRLDAFVSALEMQRVSLTDFALIGRASDVYGAQSISFSDALAALRIIAHLQPIPEKGAAVKGRLMQKAFVDPGPSSTADMLLLRNFNWKPFSAGPIDSDALTSAFGVCFESPDDTNSKKEILVSIFEGGLARDEWRTSGAQAVASLNSRAASGLAPAIWAMLSSDLEGGTEALRKAPAKVLDSAMATAAPILPATIGDSVRLNLAKERYFQAETALLHQRHNGNLFAALKEACTRDHSLFGKTAIEVTLGAMRAHEVVDAALQFDEKLVVSEAVARITTAPSLVYPHNLADAGVQGLWLRALRTSVDAWYIHENADEVQDRLFGALGASGVDPELLNRLMETPLGDWFTFSQRARVWELLETHARHIALEKTAKHWISVYPLSIENRAFFSPETPLAIAIAAQSQRPTLQVALNAGSLDQALDTFLGNENLPSDMFVETIAQFRRLGHIFRTEQAQRAGHLVSARKWKLVTRTLFSRFGAARDLRPFFTICASHLSLWDQIFNSFSTPSREQLFDLLTEASCELYPTGPSHSAIWERAGGDGSTLDLNGTGQMQWHAAIRKIRYGGRMRAKDLVTAMIEDFPLNARLQYLLEAL